jgi:hypothetical protein
MAGSRSDGVVAATQNAQADEALSAELQQAVSDGIASTPIFNTYSTALAGKLRAEADGYKAQVADIDAKIAALQAERTDLMLSYSMLSAAMSARERGQS